jgi:two-component system, sensor histidine kinase and response regulator
VNLYLLKNWWYSFSTGGPSTQFGLEHRLFNTCCFFGIFAACLGGLINLGIGLPLAAVLLNLGFGILFGWFFFLGRYRNRFKPLAWPFAISTLVYIDGLWFYNGGTTGPIPLYLVLAVLLSSIITRQKRLSVLLVLVNSLTLLVVEYYYPHLVYVNSSRIGNFFDLAFSYVTVVIFTALSIYVVHHAYNKEKEVVEAQKETLEHFNQLKTKFLSIISHDVRAPLSSIKGTLQLLQMGGLTPTEWSELSRNLVAEVDNTNELLVNLLHWSRSQTQHLQASPEACDLAALSIQTCQLLAPWAAKKEVKLVCQIPPGTLAWADAEMLKLVIRNLASNAIKFSHPSGQVTLGTVAQPGHTVLFVADQGVGMTPEQQEVLFQSGLDSQPGTANERGSGLGLTLCKEFVTLHQGRIWVESEPGQGSTFFVALPTKFGPSAPCPAAKMPQGSPISLA